MTRPSDTCQPYPKDLATSHFGRRLSVPGDDSLPNKSANDLSNCDLVKLQMIIRIIWSFCAHQCKTVDQGSLNTEEPWAEQDEVAEVSCEAGNCVLHWGNSGNSRSSNASNFLVVLLHFHFLLVSDRHPPPPPEKMLMLEFGFGK